MRLFDARTGKATLTLKGHTSNVNALAFSPDGKQLVSASGLAPQRELKIGRRGQAGEVILWDLATGKARHTWKAHPFGAFAVAWAPDGTLVATGGGTDPNTFGDRNKGPARAIFLWDARTGKLARSFPVEVRFGVKLLAFSPDGKWLVHNAERDGTSVLRFVASETGKEVRVLPGSGKAIAFSKDGSLLASVGAAIEIWDTKTGKCLARHIPPEGANAVAFHPAGRSLATGGSDRVIRLWDIVGGRKR